MIHFDKYLFLMGWNHQLGKINRLLFLFGSFFFSAGLVICGRGSTLVKVYMCHEMIQKNMFTPIWSCTSTWLDNISHKKRLNICSAVGCNQVNPCFFENFMLLPFPKGRPHPTAVWIQAAGKSTGSSILTVPGCQSWFRWFGCCW